MGRMTSLITDKFMKIYKANRKGFINYLLVGSAILPLLVFFMSTEITLKRPFILLPLLSPVTLLVWVYFGTQYQIENDKFKYRSAFIRGEVDIPKIREIITGKTAWVGTKAGIAKNGLTIKYNSYDEVYVAPESNEELLTDLLKINPLIIVSTLEEGTEANH
jgi:hypothetical protein